MRTSRRIFLKSAVGLTGAATAFHASAASRFLPGQVGKWKLADTKEYLRKLCKIRNFSQSPFGGFIFEESDGNFPSGRN